MVSRCSLPKRRLVLRTVLVVSEYSLRPGLHSACLSVLESCQALLTQFAVWRGAHSRLQQDRVHLLHLVAHEQELLPACFCCVNRQRAMQAGRMQQYD